MTQIAAYAVLPMPAGRLLDRFGPRAVKVRGIQSQGVGACLKHFAANNQESHRFRIDTLMDERTLRELYLSGFETALKLSDPWMVVSSCNTLNGTHVCESEEMIQDILRCEFGFLGVVVSDWLAVSGRVQVLRAGLDLEMPSSGRTWDREIAKARGGGELTPGTIDLACARVIAVALQAADARRAAHERRHPSARRGKPGKGGRHRRVRRAAAIPGRGQLTSEPHACVHDA